MENIQDRNMQNSDYDVELNSIIKVAIYIFIIQTLLAMINRIIEFQTMTLLGQQTEGNFRIFWIVYLFMVLLFVTGSIIILRFKNLWGYFIVIISVILSMFFPMVLNYFFNEKIFNDSQNIIAGLIRLFVYSLLLLLKRDGKSAYQVLYFNFRKSLK